MKNNENSPVNEWNNSGLSVNQESGEFWKPPLTKSAPLKNGIPTKEKTSSADDKTNTDENPNNNTQIQ